MSPKRPSPSRASTPTREVPERIDINNPPSTPRQNMDSAGDVIMSSQGVLVPPSPSLPNGMFDQDTASRDATPLPIRKAKTRHVLHDRTGAGIKKLQLKGKSSVRKLVDATAGATATVSEDAIQKPFRFMDLPGEIRNLVYHHAFTNPKQALLVHRPRMATLRPRTRLDRQRTLESDVKDRELGMELSTPKKKSRRVKATAKDPTKRETHRPFWGLTQVCSQIRGEFRPIYLQKQEIGMDLTEIVEYLSTFYFTAPAEFAKLNDGVKRTMDMPFNGNLTIAVGEKPNDLESSVDGVEVIPLLDLWANSFKIEAGFGRYLKPNYVPQTDGEAKDLYRLFGRRVMRNRQCSAMNNLWRAILRARALASVTLHRKPASHVVEMATPTGPTPVTYHLRPLTTHITVETKPFIHILFRAECAESWMTERVSSIPKTPVDWLALHGFGGMEHFEVKVGVAPAGLDLRTQGST